MNKALFFFSKIAKKFKGNLVGEKKMLLFDLETNLNLKKTYCFFSFLIIYVFLIHKVMVLSQSESLYLNTFFSLIMFWPLFCVAMITTLVSHSGPFNFNRVVYPEKVFAFRVTSA